MSAPAPRRRDAAASRTALLDAAQELFADRGFDATTVRDIGVRAGVDPALIARYFGSKTGLYLAALHAEKGDAAPPDLLAPGRVAELLARVDARGAGPVVRTALQAHDDPAVQEAVAAELRARLVAPLADRFAAAGRADAALRAEVAVAAFAGVCLARGAGTLSTLAGAPVEDLVAQVLDLLPGA